MWVTQKTMAEIFDIDRTVVTKHLKNIFNDEESDKNQVCAKFAHTANDGKTYNIDFYNLNAIDKANEEYDKYKIKQDLEYISSMDEMYKKYLEENK